MDDISSLIMSVVEIIISITGVIITILYIEKGFSKWIGKAESQYAIRACSLDKMSTMPYEILELLQNIIDSKNNTTSTHQKELMDKMNRIFSTIYAYGTSASIHILAAMQSENY